MRSSSLGNSNTHFLDVLKEVHVLIYFWLSQVLAVVHSLSSCGPAACGILVPSQGLNS